MLSNNLFLLLESVLSEQDLVKKLDKVKDIYEKLNEGSLDLSEIKNIKSFKDVGRPEYPKLVPPKEVKPRKLNSNEGIAAFLHAIAHIEFNAVNLACDAAYRFQDMPFSYYKDWLQVASEEVKHFGLLNDYLRELGYKYGDFVAHNSLWELAYHTKEDVLIRMGLVPRVMEARGLDVTPSIIKKFEQIGDKRAVEILSIILREEVGHVKIGNYWYHYLCQTRGLNPIETFKSLLDKYLTSPLRPPFSFELRKLAGFTEEELNFLEKLAL